MFGKMHANDFFEISPNLTSENCSQSDCYEAYDANFTAVAANASEFASPANDTEPDDLKFTQNSLTVVLVYCALFLVAAVGNLTVFISLFRSRHRKSRISLMIRHLAIADLVVTFIMIPLEVSWRITVQWLAGNVACKAFLFLRAFGLYLSSNVLVCVSLDRYFAVLHPLKVNDARRRGKFMLACAWGISLLYSVPQSVVFHVSSHPKRPHFVQCVTFGSFASPSLETAYNTFCVMVMYFIPLLVMMVAYGAIFWEISKKSKETKGETLQNSNGRMRLRRSDISNIQRARCRTLKMTVTIVVVFILCWTPYVVMTMWYMVDRASALALPAWLQDSFFVMAVSNSCMNPLVYGSYAINFRKEFCKCLKCLSKTGNKNDMRNVDVALAPGQGGIARRVIKCVLNWRKVGSGVTRSTAIAHGCADITRSPARNNNINDSELLKKKRANGVIRRPPSAGHISFLSEQHQDDRESRSVFHSEPLPCACAHQDPASAGPSCHSSAEMSSPTGDVV